MTRPLAATGSSPVAASVLNPSILHGLVIGEEQQLDTAFCEFGRHIDQPLSRCCAVLRDHAGFAVSARLELDILLIDIALGFGDAPFNDWCPRLIGGRLAYERTGAPGAHSRRAGRRLCNRTPWIDNDASSSEAEVAVVLAASTEHRPPRLAQGVSASAPTTGGEWRNDS